MIERDLYQHLVDNVPLVDSRVYQMTFPQDVEKPAILITVISDNAIQEVAFKSLGRNKRIQIDIYDEGFYDCKSIKDKVLVALGTFKPAPQNINVQSIYEHEVFLYRDIVEFVCVEVGC